MVDALQLAGAAADTVVLGDTESGSVDATESPIQSGEEQ